MLNTGAENECEPQTKEALSSCRCVVFAGQRPGRPGSFVLGVPTTFWAGLTERRVSPAFRSHKHILSICLLSDLLALPSCAGFRRPRSTSRYGKMLC